MRLIHSMRGVVALIVPAEEVEPEGGVVIEDLIKIIADDYHFAVRPQIQNIGMTFPQPFGFQAGWLEVDNSKVPIFQLFVFQNGGMVSAATTEIADEVLDDYMARADSKLGFRFKAAKTARRTYLSNIVVEFEDGIERLIEPLMSIGSLLDREIPRQGGPFRTKRMAFGFGPVATLPMLSSLEAVENSDFLIERREGEPITSNRYFCAAPTTTENHIRILGLLAKELADQAASHHR
jgi:hypothetical protein